MKEEHYDKLDKLTSQDFAATSSWINFQENVQREWGLAGVDTGIHPLNLAIGGLMPKEVIIIAARSGVGKSAVMIPILKASTEWTDVKPEYITFSWEMDPTSLVSRMISFDTGLTSRDLIIGARLLEEDDISKVKKSIEDSKKVSTSYHLKSTNITEVEAIFEQFAEKCKNMTSEDGIKRQPIALIDYIGLADLEGDGGIRTYAINTFLAAVKQCANRHNGTFVILAQISRGADKKEMPDRADLADSQSIESNADVLCILHRPQYQGVMTMHDPQSGDEISSKNKMLFRVLKCRQFGPSEFITSCDIARNRFWDMDLGVDYNYKELYKDESFWRQHFGFEKKALKIPTVADQADIFEQEKR